MSVKRRSSSLMASSNGLDLFEPSLFADTRSRCPICNIQFDSPDQVELHIDLVHMMVANAVRCNVCRQVFPNDFQMETHRDVYHPTHKRDCNSNPVKIPVKKQPVVCLERINLDQAKAAINEKAKETAVKSIKQEPLPNGGIRCIYRCRICAKFDTLLLPDIRAHVISTHKPNPFVDPEDYVLTVMPRTLTPDNKVAIKSKTLTRPSGNKMKPGAKGFECLVCFSHTAETEAGMQSHITVSHHGKPFIGMTYVALAKVPTPKKRPATPTKTPPNKTRKVDSSPPKKSSFQCRLCKDFYGANEATVIMHVQRTHKIERVLPGHFRQVQREEVHPCGFCKVRVKSAELLKAHMLKAHKDKLTSQDKSPSKVTIPKLTAPDKATLTCKQCAFSTSDMQQFRDHAAKFHAPMGKYGCVLCGLPTTTKKTLDAHAIKCHYNEDRNRFVCSKCPFDGVSFNVVKKHHEEKHKL